MAYDVKLIGAKLRRWENYLNNFHLPQWDELPDMDLYMDQVVMLLQRYLKWTCIWIRWSCCCSGI